VAKPKVVISQVRLTYYRVPLFERMREQAEGAGIDFHIVHGQPSDRDRSRKDSGELAWADTVTNTYLRYRGASIVWQPMPRHLRDAALYVFPQENRNLSTYPYLFRLTARQACVAYWGHGMDFQASSTDNLRQRWKRALIGRVDYWFAYTDMTVDILRRNGYPENRITNLNNSIDTTEFRRECDSVDADRIAEFLSAQKIRPGEPIGVYCGSLYAEKRLDLLVDAADIVRRRLPNFHAVIVGAGPSLPFLEAAASTRPWLHLVGVRRGVDKATIYKASQVMLNPGLVGLHVLDSFVAGLPMVSTRDAKHSPEVAYLQDGVNGLLTDGTAQSYADGVIKLLEDRDLGLRMAEAAKEASTRFSIEAMAERFVGGLETCLRLGRYRR
jgi:glycosyltransferase involved in cell wall biosynthesis